MLRAQNDRVWFGIEQEYWLLGSDGTPLGCEDGMAKDIGRVILGTWMKINHLLSSYAGWLFMHSGGV